MITCIHHVALKCHGAEEYEKVKDFYQNILDLKMKGEWSGGCHLTAGNAVLEIFKKGAEEGGTGSIPHYSLGVDDMNKVCEVLTKAGYEVYNGPRDIELPLDPPVPATIAFVKGPLGEEIEFFQER